MGIDDWQRQLLLTLTRLEAGVSGLTTQVDGLTTQVDGLTTQVDGLRTDVDGLRADVDGLRTETRTDIQKLTRMIVRRFGSGGATQPVVGDHVHYHLRAGCVCPAVVMNAIGDEVDLDVMGDAVSLRERFPRKVPFGTAPGCWSFPT